MIGGVTLEAVSLLDIIVDGFFIVVAKLKSAVPLTVFGFSITWWQLIISLFICTTVINIIVGADGDADED